MERYPINYDLTHDIEEFKKDCPNYDYIPIIKKPVKRIIAIGDIHGDLKLAIAILRMVKVIDDHLNWIAEPKDTHIVQVGDQVDSCRPYAHTCENPEETSQDEPHDVTLLKFFTALHEKAKKHGGAVYSLLGNHEIMNAEGNMNYVSYANMEEFKNYKDPAKPDLKFATAKEARLHAFKPGNEYANFMACTRTSAIIIGSNLFVHAGVLPTLTEGKTKHTGDQIAKVANINKMVRKWLLGKIDHDSVKRLLDDPSISPFWTRILGNIPADKLDHPDCERKLKKVLEVFQLGRMIIGHTPQFLHKHGINATCNGKLWRVDVGASKAFDKFSQLYGDKNGNRKVQALEIIDDNIARVIPTATLKSKL